MNILVHAWCFLFLFVTCQITLMRWKTLLIQQKTTISVGLHLIFTTSNNLDGMENINSSIENNNTVNLDQHKSPFFGSLYFYPPPQGVMTPPCAYLLWYSSRILCSSPAWTTFWVVLVISSPSFMNFLVLVIVLYWLLLSYRY